MNAIILAAGLGSRFKELTTHSHKSMFPIEGTPNLERTLAMLTEAGVNDIYVVTGHNAHVLRPAIEKFNATELHNPDFKTKNNAYSLKVASPYFGDSWVIDADVVLFENVFKTHFDRATEYLITRESGSPEWVPLMNDAHQFERIEVTSEPKPSLLGVSFWPQKEAQAIKAVLDTWSDDTFANSKLYWCDIAKSLIEAGKIDVFGHVLSAGLADELDNVDDYQRILSGLKNQQ